MAQGEGADAGFEVTFKQIAGLDLVIYLAPALKVQRGLYYALFHGGLLVRSGGLGLWGGQRLCGGRRL